MYEAFWQFVLLRFVRMNDLQFFLLIVHHPIPLHGKFRLSVKGDGRFFARGGVYPPSNGETTMRKLFVIGLALVVLGYGALSVSAQKAGVATIQKSIDRTEVALKAAGA